LYIRVTQRRKVEVRHSLNAFVFAVKIVGKYIR
jgi:hypothetical protein